MHYCYILLSTKSHIFYYGSTKNVKIRFEKHNKGEVQSTKAYIPWKLVWFAGFETKRQAEDFERYLKSGSGKAFAYKRLISKALMDDLPFRKIRSSIPKY